MNQHKEQSPMRNPHWLHNHLQTHDIDKVNAAIAEAETKTSGEIVVVLVPRAHTYQHSAAAIVAVATFLGLCAVLLVNVLRPFADSHSHTIGTLAIAAGFTVAGLLLSQLTPLRRLLLHPAERNHATAQRAELEFYRLGIKNTRAQTGVLVFISFFERRVLVLADQAINNKLPAQQTWANMVDVIVNGIKTDQLASGLLQAITIAGTVLAEHFPGDHSDNPNELPDHLIIYPE